MYKNIVFDLGGVMVDFDPKEYLVDRFCNAAIEERVYGLTFGGWNVRFRVKDSTLTVVEVAQENS